MLIEETAVPDGNLPVNEFRSHLRLGSGFGDDTLQDPVLMGFLRAAISAVEARTGKALLQRDYLWSVSRWSGSDGEVLPIAPVATLNAISLRMRDGSTTGVDLNTVDLLKCLHSPRIRANGGCLPTIPQGGSAEIRFTAGLGATWGDLPADIAQSVLLLGAHYYEFRSETTLSAGCMPFGVASLIERYKPRRIGLTGGVV